MKSIMAEFSVVPSSMKETFYNHSIYFCLYLHHVFDSRLYEKQFFSLIFLFVSCLSSHFFHLLILDQYSSIRFTHHPNLAEYGRSLLYLIWETQYSNNITI